MRGHRGLIVALAMLLAVAGVTGCERATVGKRCRGDGFGFDSTHVLQCRSGRWARVMTLQRYAELLTTPAPLTSPLSGAFAVAAGRDAACVIRSGDVACWGASDSGQTGRGEGDLDLVPRLVPGVAGASQLFLGVGQHACVTVGELATVTCWGANRSGQLGTGTVSPSSRPAEIPGSSSTLRVAVGGAHTCGVLSTGSVDCWGLNTVGQLGLGTLSEYVASPTRVPGLADAVDIAAGKTHTCAVLRSGGVRCWGSNELGQLGDGTRTETSTPVDVVGITDATRVVAGDWHSCAIVGGGLVKCWGANYGGQLGNGVDPAAFPAPGPSAVPVSVLGLSGMRWIDAGLDSTCAGAGDGGAMCWGYGAGDAPTSDQRTVDGAPHSATVDGPTAYVSVGLGFSCTLAEFGRVGCRGNINGVQFAEGTPYGVAPPWRWM